MSVGIWAYFIVKSVKSSLISLSRNLNAEEDQQVSVTLHPLLLQKRIALQVVAFVKGTRTQPQCGFSHKVLSILNEVRAPYEVVSPLQWHSLGQANLVGCSDCFCDSEMLTFRGLRPTHSGPGFPEPCGCR